VGPSRKVLILVQRPQHKSTLDSVGEPKTSHFCSILIEFGDTKKCYTFSGLELVPKSSKKLIGGLSCMHKGQKCIQILWNHWKKIAFVEKHKKCAICAILREKKTLLGHTQRLKNVLHVVRCAKHASQRPKHNACKSLGAIRKKCSFCRKSAILSVR